MLLNTSEKTSSPSLFDTLSNMGHEQVVFCNDNEAGLKAIVAIHNTVLGPALGGTRMWDYATEGAALTDALRLSRGMTYKSALAEVNLGGGKAVIIGKPYQETSELMWRRYGQFLEGLGGKYITAEDVGASPQNMAYVAMETNNVTGLPEDLGGSGDPSSVTAYGVYVGMKASAKQMWGNDSLEGRTVGVQGIGNVGENLVKLLAKENAKVYITDIREPILKRVAQENNATIIAPDAIYDLDMDIFAPCALGAILNDQTIPRLKCSIVSGAANNQLKDEPVHGKALIDRGILYAPDFLVNAGGILKIYYLEIINSAPGSEYRACDAIYNRLLKVFKKSEAEGITSHRAAELLAEDRIAKMAYLKSKV